MLWGLAFWPILPDLCRTWINHSNNSHGILVPFISLYFIWQKKINYKELARELNYWVVAILAISFTVYLISHLGGIAFIARLFMVFSVIVLARLNLEESVFKDIRFPLWYLLFMVPIPDSLISIVSLPLQLTATTISASVINALSIPVLQEGNMLYFANTQLEVAEACSGIRSIVSLTMIAVLLVYLSRSGRLRNAILILSAIPIALFINVCRISGTGILARYFGGAVARGFLHEFSGIVVFVVGMILLGGEYYLLGKGIRR